MIRTKRIARKINSLLISRVMSRRVPDKTIHQNGCAYLHRWYLTPWRGWYDDQPNAKPTLKNRLLKAVAQALPNVYVHLFVSSDPDEALHDHPWFSLSLVLHGQYWDVTGGGCFDRKVCAAGDWILRGAKKPHRVELGPQSCMTLFITGPVIRRWGFHCRSGWMPWQKYIKGGCAQ